LIESGHTARHGGEGVEVREVAPGVHRLGTPLVNWYLVEGDGGALTAVDAGLPRYGRRLVTELASLGRRIDDVAAVVLTHGHADHVGMAPALTTSGARIHAHPGDGELIRNREQQKPEVGLASYLLRHRAACRFVAHFVRNGGLRVAGLEFDPVADGERLDIPGRPRALHTPGHTRGHCAWHFEDRGVLFVGDAIVTWNPFTGRRGPQIPTRASNADSEGCMRSLLRLVDVQASVVLSGHGDPMIGPPAKLVERVEATGCS
jgi:glyoxylase-like metal-dependent hydrolase (beta-lactamase superfamily II)